MLVRLNEENVIREILPVPAGCNARDCYHPDIIAGCVFVDNDAEIGWVYDPETEKVSAPAEETPADEPVDEPVDEDVDEPARDADGTVL